MSVMPLFWIVAWVRPKSWNSAMKASTGAHIATTPKSCGDKSRDRTMTETIWVATRTDCARAVTTAPRPTDLRSEPSGGSNALASKFRIPDVLGVGSGLPDRRRVLETLKPVGTDRCGATRIPQFFAMLHQKMLQCNKTSPVTWMNRGEYRNVSPKRGKDAEMRQVRYVLTLS